MYFRNLIYLSILVLLSNVFTLNTLLGQEYIKKSFKFSYSKPAFQYTEAFLYTDSSAIQINGKYFGYKPIRGRAVIGEVFGKGKKYKDGLTSDKGGGADIIRVVDGNKVKETVVVNDTSIHSYRYVINTNMSMLRIGNYIYLDSTVGYIAPPVGWDADSNAVNVTFELSGDTITYSWSKTDSVLSMNYPVSIDPTVIFNSNDSEDDPMTQGSPTTNYGALDQIHMRGDSAGTDMLNGWIRFDIDSVAFTDSVVSAKLFFTSKQANFNGSATYSVHLVKVGLPIEAQITWNIWKTSNNWNLAGARGGADIYYSDPAPITGHSFNAAGAGQADSVDITTLVRKIAGKDSSLANYGFLLLVTTRGNGNTIYYASSEHATAAYRPYLRVETIEETVPNVYPADSLHFNTLTDTSAKLLNIALPSIADTTNTNRYSIKYNTNGYWVQPQDSSDNPFNKNEQKYVYSVLKNITLPLARNYKHWFTIYSRAANGSDSTESAVDSTLILGTPGSGSTTTDTLYINQNTGRWDPEIDKIY